MRPLRQKVKIKLPLILLAQNEVSDNHILFERIICTNGKMMVAVLNPFLAVISDVTSISSI